jgi:predicted esterase
MLREPLFVMNGQVVVRRGARPALLCCWAAVASVGCPLAPAAEPIGRPVPHVAEQPSVAPTPAPARAQQDPPEAGRPFIELAVAGFGPAIVSVPRGATGPHPVIVATHGAGGRPEWKCAAWREIAGDGGYVVCPRGRPLAASDPVTGYFYPDHHDLSAEVTASLAALKGRFGDKVDLEAPLYAGFSQGAVMGSLILPDHPARFARAMLIEGSFDSYDEWTLLTARRFKQGGGDRVVFACGRALCAERARRSAALLRRATVEARVLHVKGAGHTYAGPMTGPLQEAFAWLTENDPRWARPEPTSASGPSQVPMRSPSIGGAPRTGHAESTRSEPRTTP